MLWCVCILSIIGISPAQYTFALQHLLCLQDKAARVCALAMLTASRSLKLQVRLLHSRACHTCRSLACNADSVKESEAAGTLATLQNMSLMSLSLTYGDQNAVAHAGRPTDGGVEQQAV